MIYADTDVGFIASTYPYNGKIRDFGLVSATVEALGDHPGGPRVGALVGDLDEVDYYTGVFGCFATGRVTATGQNSNAGGLVGWLSDGIISRSWANVAVTGSDNSLVGGLVGNNYYVGGIVDSYATGSATGGNGATVGGLVGGVLADSAFNTYVWNSYASGSVTGGNNAVVGGLVGAAAYYNQGENFIQESYSTGAVLGGTASTTGGSIGSYASTKNDILDAYWDLDTSGITDPGQGAGNVANERELLA